jgi:hypothetical protein
MSDTKPELEKHIELTLSRLKQVRGRRILLAAILVVAIALFVSFGFVDYPQGSVRILSYGREFADRPSDYSYFADQLKLRSTEGASLSFHVVDWTNDVWQWLLYHKSQLIIEVTISIKPVVPHPVLAAFILDNDGLIRGYKLVDLLDFADTRPTLSSYGTYLVPQSLNANVTLNYQPPSDVKNMRLWLVLYSVKTDNYGLLGISEDAKYQRVVSPAYREVLSSQDIAYTYLNYQDLSWMIGGGFLGITAVFGLIFDLFVVKRIPKTDPIWPFFVYLVLFTVGVIVMFWYFFRFSP